MGVNASFEEFLEIGGILEIDVEGVPVALPPKFFEKPCFAGLAGSGENQRKASGLGFPTFEIIDNFLFMAEKRIGSLYFYEKCG